MMIPPERSDLVEAGCQASRCRNVVLVPVWRPWLEWRSQFNANLSAHVYVVLWHVRWSLREEQKRWAFPSTD